MGARWLGPGSVDLSVEEWEGLQDPVGGRFEIIDGVVVMVPSPDATHNRFGEDLADHVRWMIEQSELPLDVTIDVEWRVVEDGVVRQAPRGDLVVGHIDPSAGIHLVRPLLVVEIWDRLSRPKVRNDRRLYWAARGLRHYWQVLLVEPPVIEVYDLPQVFAPINQAAGSEALVVTEPFPLQVVPDEVVGWTLRQLQLGATAAARAEAATARADEAAARAAAEAARADAAEAELARLRAELEQRRRTGR